MARPLRIELAGGLYHISSRGNRGEETFTDDADRQAFLEILGAVSDRMKWICHAYCLLPNHYHLVVETPQPNLAKGMRQLNGVYTQTFNRRHKRAGHIFQGRYKAVLVDRDPFLLEVIRHVLVSPVQLRLVRDATQWRWSSCRATMGKADQPHWLHTDWILEQFAKNRKKAQENFVEFLKEGKTEANVWESLRNQIYLGDEKFLRRMQRKVGGKGDGEAAKSPRQSARKPLDFYGRKYKDRTEAMAQAYLSGEYSMKAIGDFFSVHYATVSRAVKRFEQI